MLVFFGAYLVFFCDKSVLFIFILYFKIQMLSFYIKSINKLDIHNKNVIVNFYIYI